MNTISKFDFEEKYQPFITDEKSYETHLDNLLTLIKTEENPISLKDQLLGILQLYFDGICEKPAVSHWDRQAITLYSLFNSTAEFLGHFYDGSLSDTNEVKETFLQQRDELLSHGSQKDAKHRCLEGLDVRMYLFGQNIGLDYADKKIESVMGIASGGFEPSLLAWHILGNDLYLPVRFSCVHRKDEQIILPSVNQAEYLTGITDKNVLLVDDFTMAGKTLRKVENLLIALEPKKLYSEIVQDNRMSADYFF